MNKRIRRKKIRLAIAALRRCADHNSLGCGQCVYHNHDPYFCREKLMDQVADLLSAEIGDREERYADARFLIPISRQPNVADQIADLANCARNNCKDCGRNGCPDCATNLSKDGIDLAKRIRRGDLKIKEATE